MDAQDLPVTPEIRAKMAAAQSQALTRLGLDEHVIAVWEDGYRAHDDAAHTFEWWYFDMQLDDGSTVVATFSNKPHVAPDGPLEPSVLLIYHGPDGTKSRTVLAYEQFSAATERCDVRIGPNTVVGDLDSYAIHLESEGLSIDLTLTRGAPSWRPGAGVSFFDAAQTQYLSWVVPVPYGTVSGTITEKGASRPVTGTGYHDHNWGNRLMSDWLDHWYWGRAHIDDFTIVYVRMTTKGLFGLGSLNLPTFFLAKGETIITDDLLPLRLETSGDMAGPGHQTYPTDLLWTWQTEAGAVTMHVTNPVMIEALEMTPDMPAWRKPLVNLFEHPMYYDFNADMELTVDVDGIHAHVSGRTLYEKMMFR
jgi:predicted secreted hydrolase